MRRRFFVPLAFAIALAGLAGTGELSFAHELITPEAADRYIGQANRYSGILRSREPAPIRADAALALAKMLDEIKELLNRDLASHGRVQGLPSQMLGDRLKQSGHPMVWLDALGRFGAPVDLYKTAFELDPKGRRSNEALVGYLFGSFYDGFREDPLKPIQSDGANLIPLIETGERLTRDYPREPFIEETRFITAILLIRAARAGVGDRRIRSARARELMAQFQRDYPDSLRSAAIPVFLDALP
jgi:hypothetical protein